MFLEMCIRERVHIRHRHWQAGRHPNMDRSVSKDISSKAVSTKVVFNNRSSRSVLFLCKSFPICSEVLLLNLHQGKEEGDDEDEDMVCY